MASGGAVVYWERQGADRLCGIHCANAILQGPRFVRGDFEAIAKDLDRQEQELLGEAKLDGSPSPNWDSTGNFSLPVLQRALQQAAGLELIYVDRGDVNRDPSRECGFVANSHVKEHWFAVRRVGGRWWDLDSLKSAPRLISEAQLVDNLEEVRGRGFTVFAVRPNSDASNSAAAILPEPVQPRQAVSGASSMDLLPHQFYLTDEDVIALSVASAPASQIGAASESGGATLLDTQGQAQNYGALGREGIDWRRMVALLVLATVVVGGAVGVVVIIVKGGGSV